jgi:hypothetical protein
MLFHSPPGIFDPREHAVRRLGSMPVLSELTEVCDA